MIALTTMAPFSTGTSPSLTPERAPAAPPAPEPVTPDSPLQPREPLFPSYEDAPPVKPSDLDTVRPPSRRSEYAD
jgi:hypothetical protein